MRVSALGPKKYTPWGKISDNWLRSEVFSKTIIIINKREEWLSDAMPSYFSTSTKYFAKKWLQYPRAVMSSKI